MVLSPQSKPTTGIMRFLPAISVAPPLVARVPESPPLLLPDPRQDVPSSLARSVQDQARPRPPSRSGPDVSPPALAVGTLADAPAIPSTTGVGGGGDLFTAPLEQSPTALPPAADEARRWLWPVHGKISQSFSSAHRAIDVVSGHGALVVAADGGEVVYAEWEISGYGYLVIVDHGDGYRTYYGHLYGFYVDVGQRVERGDLLGELGNTGRSTGPHLHFEIRYRDIPRDPLGLLPSDPPVGRDDPATGQP